MLRCFVTLLLAALAPGFAAPPLSTVHDILYKADGTRFNGAATIEWKSFQAAEGSSIAPNILTLKVVNGVLRVQLVPTTNASHGAYYLVRYNSDGRIQFTERWSVPPSGTPLRLRDIRVSGTGSSPDAGNLLITEVVGLAEELAARPVKGAGYAPSRAVVANAAGELEGAAGDPTDCVRVDGTTGPCGSGGWGGNPGFVDLETPAGLVDGANPDFTLALIPSPPASLLLHRNGILQKQGFDYTLSARAITFLANSTPQPGDVLLASYRRVDLGNPAVFGQVICSAAGSATTATSETRLGRCTVPASMIQPGDRFDIRFDYSHEGSASGFLLTVKWGAASIALRTAAANETAAAGKADISVRSGGGQWSAQTWGAALALSAGAGSTPDAGANPVDVDFLGAMTGEGSDTVTLRNFTVIRYAQQPGS